MQAGAASLPPPDWTSLPADILQLVFSHALAPPPAPSAGLPLTRLVRQRFALAATCKHWRDAVQGIPLAVELTAAPAACLAWLAARPVRLLHIASSAEAGLALALEEFVFSGGLAAEQEADALEDDDSLNQLRNMGQSSEEKEAYQRERSIACDPQMHAMFPWVAAAAGRTVSLDSMMRELEGVLDEGSPTQQPAPKLWSLATWQQLESLHLEGPVNWHGDNSNFSAASLSSLTRLHSLSLACFYDYDLSGLPPTLRRLRLHYEPYLVPETADFEERMYYSISLLELPETARLDQLVVEKRDGEVAFEWQALSRRCRRLVLHAGLGRDAGGLHVSIGVPLPLEKADLWEALNQAGAQPSRQQETDAQASVIAAWLGDFAHSGDCLLDELCLGWHDSEGGYRDHVQLAPLAPSQPSSSQPSSGSGASGSRLRGRRRIALPLLDAAPALRQAAVWHPGRLACLERLRAEFRALPGLLSLVRQASVAVAPAEA